VKISHLLYVLGLSCMAAGIVQEAREIQRAKAAEVWTKAQSDGNGSSSSQPLPRQPQSSQTDSA